MFSQKKDHILTYVTELELMMVTLAPFIIENINNNNDIFIVSSYTVGKLGVQIILEIKQHSEIRCSLDMLDFAAMILRSDRWNKKRQSNARSIRLSLPQDCSGKLASIMPTTPTLLEIEDIQQSSLLS